MPAQPLHYMPLGMKKPPPPQEEPLPALKPRAYHPGAKTFAHPNTWKPHMTDRTQMNSPQLQGEALRNVAGMPLPAWQTQPGFLRRRR